MFMFICGFWGEEKVKEWEAIFFDGYSDLAVPIRFILSKLINVLSQSRSYQTFSFPPTHLLFRVVAFKAKLCDEPTISYKLVYPLNSELSLSLSFSRCRTLEPSIPSESEPGIFAVNSKELTSHITEALKFHDNWDLNGVCAARNETRAIDQGTSLSLITWPSETES